MDPLSVPGLWRVWCSRPHRLRQGPRLLAVGEEADETAVAALAGVMAPAVVMLLAVAPARPVPLPQLVPAVAMRRQLVPAVAMDRVEELVLAAVMRVVEPEAAVEAPARPLRHRHPHNRP